MTLHFRLFLLFLCSFQNVFSQRKQLFEGDVCKVTENGVSHRCKKMHNCPSAFDMIRSDGKPQICGYAGKIPVVCCKPDKNVLSPPPVRPPVQYNPKKSQEGSKTISEQKCEEYSKHVYQPKTNIPLVIQFEEDEDEVVPSIKQSTCGILEQPLIVDGTPVAPREFPHQVNLGYRYGSIVKWLCTGSLISENFVLSAAHCTKTNFGTPKIAVIGDLVIDSEEDDAKPEKINIVEVINHPNYESDRPYHDIALYRLERNVTFDGYKRPACLNTIPKIQEKQAVATGWGNILAGGPSSSHLQKVRLDLFSKDTCDEYWSKGGSLKRGIDHEQMICAGDLKGRKDTCQGDSGGPLQNSLLTPYCMYSIIGVTSFGRSCGIKVPGVYTRVSYFVPWIESIVWPN